MKASEWTYRIREYGRSLRVPPPRDLETADVVPIAGQDGAWSVWYRLWTEEEGKSDLGIELTVRYAGGDEVAVEIDDLRVA